MDTYLMHYNGRGRIVDLDTRETTADQFGEMQKCFARKVGAVDGNYADMFRLFPDQVRHGVNYLWGLAGPGGAYFTLIKLPDTTIEQLRQASESIRHTDDVVSMQVLKINDLI